MKISSRWLHILLLITFVLGISCQKTSDLPVINILKKETIGKKVKESCTIKYTDQHDKLFLKASIKRRGGFSIQYNKHSYALELDDKFAPAHLPPDDDWILNANYIDKTFMRHKISYDLFREMNPMNIAAQCAYVNLKVNNKDQGLYVLMEEVNAGMIGLNKKDSMAMLFKDPPIFYEKKLKRVQDSLNYYQQKFPKKHKSDKTTYVEQFKDFLFNTSDDEFVQHIANWIDIDNIIDWHLLLLFSNNGDGIMKNFYLYKKNANSPFEIAIWDYDHSFGRDGDNEYNMMNRPLNCNRSVLLDRLMCIPDSKYPAKLAKRWLELRQSGIISYKNFKKHIDNNHQLIYQALDKNFTLWPTDSKWYYDNNNYGKEIDLMLDFVQLRIQQLDEYFQKL